MTRIFTAGLLLVALLSFSVRAAEGEAATLVESAAAGSLATTPSNAVVRIAYIVPGNRVPQAHAVATLRNIVRRYQEWFADQMELNGFGRKTFTFETEPDGVTPFIHVLSVPMSDDFLRGDIHGSRVLDAARAAGVAVGSPGQLWWLIPETHAAFPDGTISGSFEFGRRSPAAPADSGWAMSGSDRLALYQSVYHTNALIYEGFTVPEIGPYPLVEDVSFPWFEGTSLSAISSSAVGGGLRSLAEAFGLDTDYRNDENFNGNVMGFGFRGIRGVFYPKEYPYNYCGLSYASALALDVNPFFNPSRPATDTNAPAATITTAGERTPVSGLIQINFQASDDRALHAAVLAWERDGELVVVDEMTLSGQNVTRSFSVPYFNAEQTNRYTVIVFDRHGNRHTAQTGIYPRASVNRSPQPFIIVSPLIAGPGQDIVLDASETFDPEHSAGLLEVEWDFDGDGFFDTFPVTQLVFTNNYFSLGTRVIRARITDPAGATAVSAPVAVSIIVCPTTLSPLTRFHGFAGSTGVIEVTVGPKCNWSVVNTNDWITIRSGASGAGSGEVIYDVHPNPLFAQRQGTLRIGDETFLVRQHAIECTFSLSPTNRFHGFGSSIGTIRVNTKSDCAWLALNTNSWITITSGSEGVGTGTVSYAISTNRVPNRRAGNIVIGGETFTVNQWGLNCELALNVTGRAHSENSETGLVSVTTGSACTWSAENTNSWITITTANLGTNTGSFGYLVAANPGLTPRTGVMTINGQSFTVTQGACSYAITPSSRTHSYLAQTGSVTVAAGGVCPWTANSSSDWVTILSGASGPGASTVVYAVSQNLTSNPRTVALTIAGRSFTVMQSGKPCAYVIEPEDFSHGEAGGLGEFFVSAEPGCFWAVANSAPWVTILTGETGEGSGRVSYRVSANDGPERHTTLTVGGQEYVISQASAVRVIATSSMIVASGQTNCVAITLSAHGGENNLRFSLCFDTNLLVFRSARLQPGAPAGAALTVNSSQSSSGRLGFTLSMPAGASMAAGAQPAVQVCLSARTFNGQQTTALSICDTPVPRHLVDASGRALPTSFAGGFANVIGLCSLAESLDTAQFNWTFSGAPWSCQTNITHDGVDAAVSGATPDDGESYMQTTVNGPGVVSFWWKVSSEQDSDRLRLYLDGDEQFRISGETDWEWRTLNVAAGSHTLRWRYSKGGSGLAGSDRGWVDEIVYQVAPPSITTQPVSRSVDAGATTTFNVIAAGQPPFTYQWLFNGAALADGGGILGARTATLTLSNVQPSQVGAYSVIVANAAENIASVEAILSVTEPQPLDEALDATNRIWITTGNAVWFGQPTVTRDGVDAGRSGTITHSQTTTFETTVSGPGVIRFWWKVSSQTNNDLLVFYVNGTEQARISGETDWGQRTFNVGAGTQTLRWSYSKNGSTSTGQDRGWVDQFEFAPAPVVITSQPLNQTVDAGATAIFAVAVDGAPPVSYRWQRNGADLVESAVVRGTATATLTLSNVQMGQAGNYSVLVSNPGGSAASSNALLQVTQLVPLAEAIDATSLVWTMNGPAGAGWAGQAAVTHDGFDAARSGRMGDSQTTSFQTTVIGPGTISFWWKVSSEPINDALRFYVNGLQQDGISGEVDWTWRSWPVASGNQVLEWRYVKNNSAAAGQDRGWVDEIYYVPSGTPAPPIIAIQPFDRTVIAPGAASFSAIAAGSTPLSYEWLFEGIPLADGNGVSGATTTNVTIGSTTPVQAGAYSVRVTNIAGSVTSKVATLTVIAAPEIVTQPANRNVLLGSTVDFAVAAVGTAPLSYQWQFNGANLTNGGNVSGVTSTNLRVTSATALQGGSYTVVITNAAGSVTSAVATLVISTPPVIASQPTNRTVVAGSSASFTVGANGSAPLTFQWRFNGANLTDGGGISGAKTASLLLSSVQSFSAGNYSVVVSNAVGGVTSTNAVLAVLTPPMITSHPLDRTVNEGATVTFNVAASGTAPLTYRWRRNGTNLVNGNGFSGTTTATLTLTNAQPSQSDAYSVEVSNAGGFAESTYAQLMVIPKLTLGVAVNAPYLDWTTSVPASWTPQTNVTHDGEAAAQSGNIANGSNTWLETTVNGPGTLRFWWKVSSQTNADALIFSVNGAEWEKISGIVDWHRMSFILPPGALTLRWTYAKDGSTVSGFDRGWLDEVDFLPTVSPSAPVIVSEPVSRDVDPGATVTFAVEALGTGPVSYQWRFEGQNLSDGASVFGATSPTLRLFNVQVAQSGLYDVVVRNPYSVKISEQAFLDVAPVISLPISLDTDFTNLTWRTGGFSPWRGQASVSSDRIDAAQSGPLVNSATNWIQTTIAGPCALTFWWKVSSQTNSDRLRFLVDGVEQANISGEVGWQQRAFPIEVATATIRWEYVKNASGVAGQDRGWVDRMEMLAISPLITNAAPNTNIVDQGTTVRYKVDASGSLPIRYQWRHNGTNLTNTLKVIGATTSHRIILSNAQPNQTGFYTCVVANEAGIDTSEQMYLRVNPVGPIGPAVNNTNLIWETGGYSWFFSTTDDSHNDNQSVRNGYVDDGYSTWMRTTVTGPGTVGFWWRASTQPNADFLRFSINGLVQTQISGNVNWQQRTFPVPDGVAVLQWEYAKDLLLTNGSDRVWVDDVTYTLAPPSITNLPLAQAVDVGTTVTFAAGVRGAPPLTYRWRYNGVALTDNGNISGATTPTLRITGAQVSQSGSYSLFVSNRVGSITSSNVVLTVTPILPLADGLDATYLTWATGLPGWIGQPLVTHDGVDAARSPALGDNQLSVAQATVTGPATVSFWWRVSSQTNADYLIFHVGNTEQARISGEVNWQQRTFNVPAGNHTVSWTYSKNGSGAAGQDRGWADQFVFTPTSPSITLQPVSQTVEEGARVTFTTAATGLQPIAFQWRYNGANLADGGGVSGARTTTLTISNASLARSGTYSVFLSNAAATATSADATLLVTPIVTLAVALDEPNLIWTTNGTAPWTGQSLVSHDGTDAARSGVLANNGSNSIQTTVTGPASLSFWWKVSSEPVNDRLMFLINNVEQARISGESNWAFRTFNLGAGSQTLRWTYAKNGSVVGGEDRAWVDQVSLAPLSPSITSQPTNQGVDAGATVNFRVAVSGTPPFSYQWQRDGSDLANGDGISGATSSNLVLTGVQVSQAGSYRVIVANAVGSINSAAASLDVFPVLPLAAALDTTGVTWTTTGTPPWTGHGAVTRDGIDAARSGAIGNSTTTWMETTVNGPDAVNFWWKVSSQTNSDLLVFTIDGVEQARISGEVDWNFRSFSFGSGSHVLRWTYSKNGSTVAGQDRGWVDQVRFGAVAPTIATQPASRLVNAGDSAAFTVSAAGTAPLGYRWFFNGVQVANGGGLSGATTATLTIANVQAAQLGSYSVAVSNSAGTAVSSPATLAFIPSLAEALDAPALTFTAGGTASPWSGQRAVTRDGVDAAQTGTMTSDSTYTWIKTTVNGPGTLTFWWKVSSEDNHDYLRFMLDAVDQVRIAGEVDWHQITFAVPSGSHELQWRYSRSPSGVARQDRGWVDQISFGNNPSPAPVQAPDILIQPVSQTVDEDEPVNVNVAATGSDPMSYQWFFNGTNAIADGGNLGGATATELTLFNALAGQSGNYSVVVSNVAGAATSIVARLTVNPIFTLAEAVDASELLFVGDGDALWEGHGVVTHDGMDAARSGLVGDGQSSSMQTIIDGPCTLSFWWKVSSETNADSLVLSLNGQPAAFISGEVDWEQRSFDLPSGPQFIEWTYFKNGAAAAGEDRGWVDQVSYAPGSEPVSTGAMSPRIAVIENKAVLTWEAGARRSYEVLYKDDLSDPEWKRLDSEVLATRKVAEDSVQPEIYTAIVEDLLTTRTRYYRVLKY